MKLYSPRLLQVGFLCALVGAMLFVYMPLKTQEAALRSDLSLLTEEANGLRERLAEMKHDVSSNRNARINSFQASNQSDAVVRLQEVVVNVLSGHDVTLSTYGAGGLSRQTQLDIATFEFEATMSLEQMLQVLLGFREAQEQIAVGQMTVRPARTSEKTPGKTLVSVRATVWAYWTQPS